MTNNLISYYDTITKTLINNDSFKNKILEEMNTLFEQFGFDNEQVTKVIASIIPRLEEAIDSTAKGNASKLVDIDMFEIEAKLSIDKNIEKALILDEKILIVNSEVEIIKEEIEIMKVEILNIDKNIAKISEQVITLGLEEINESATKKLKENEVLLLNQESENMITERQVIVQKKILVDREIDRMAEEDLMTGEKYLFMKKEKEIVQQQYGLFQNQKQGYGDNAMVKAAEFQGGMASFAVNADSSSAGSAISNFTATIGELLTRSGS